MKLRDEAVATHFHVRRGNDGRLFPYYEQPYPPPGSHTPPVLGDDDKLRLVGPADLHKYFESMNLADLMQKVKHPKPRFALEPWDLSRFENGGIPAAIAQKMNARIYAYTAAPPPW